MKQLKLSKDFRLNKIINKEELTKQLTFHCRVQMLPRILLLIILKNHCSGHAPFYTHPKIIGKSNVV